MWIFCVLLFLRCENSLKEQGMIFFCLLRMKVQFIYVYYIYKLKYIKIKKNNKVISLNCDQLVIL